MGRRGWNGTARRQASEQAPAEEDRRLSLQSGDLLGEVTPSMGSEGREDTQAVGSLWSGLDGTNVLWWKPARWSGKGPRMEGSRQWRRSEEADGACHQDHLRLGARARDGSLLLKMYTFI